MADYPAKGEMPWGAKLKAYIDGLLSPASVEANLPERLSEPSLSAAYAGKGIESTVKTPATLIDGGKSVTAWKRFVSGGATITAQTDEPTPYYRIATAGGAVGQIGRDVNLDLSGGRFLTMEVRARDANLKTLYVNLGAGNWAASKIFAWPQGQNGQAVQPFGWFTSGVAGAGYKFVNQPNYDVMEWHTLVVTLDATNKVGGATVADAANIRSLYLGLTPGAVAACDVDIRNIQVHDPAPKQPSGGSVIWQWDDGFVTTRTIGLPALQAAGMVGSLAVDWNVITGAGHTSNYMTLAQVQELYAAGWDMHGHDTGDQTALSDAQFETAQRAVVDFMRNNGLVRGSSYYVWPQGYRTTAKDAIRKVYFPRGARRVIPWSSGAAPYVTDSTQMGQFYVTPAKSLAQAKAAIDLAQTYNSVVHFILHDLVASGATAENWLISDFEALVAYADQVGIQSTTMSRLYGE